ncbi:hypothetical protein [Atlantibacter hermannii]|uniref:hypothetical protein n=1 Tax=Atlantibacter hermannii TaxID=565 RepID=UPI0028A18940|nr:hypothetical protein [Atlantibacter hermannii]
MKKLIASLIAMTSFATAAQCVGTNAFSTCTDVNGNNYTVSRMGGMTTVNGRNSQTGTSWSQTSNTIGNQTYTNGRASNGQSWNETQTNFGGGQRMISGRNSQGQSYSYNCNQFGCN